MDENHSREAEEELNAFQKLPFEMNEMILKNLDPISMLNFGKTSKFCDGLAGNFDDRIVSIGWNGLTEDGLRILHLKVNSYPEYWYTLDIQEASISKSVLILRRYNPSEKKEIEWWKQEINGNCLDIIIQYFFDLLKRNRNSINSLYIKADKCCKGKLGEKMLSIFPKNLENIGVSNEFPLIDKLYSIDSVKIYATNLNIEQLKQFKSSEISISAENICYEDLKEYLILWRDGKLHENLKKVELIGESNDIFRKIHEEMFAVNIGQIENIQNGFSNCFVIPKTNEENLQLAGRYSEFLENDYQNEQIISKYLCFHRIFMD
ncbi:unnamed protein product [Caenorhabditis angaria]|uniref:F-box domain-containing protein n=1 Tax=Caenorhabditis angaria TaxID=860376 RepID=A0A9P1N792_9PELO|nr:unnamed protein product [Caenorhabditis angaria]